MVCIKSCVSRYEDVHVGECAELLLLSNTPDFSSFKVGAQALPVMLCILCAHKLVLPLPTWSHPVI